MKSRRFVLATAFGLAAAPILSAVPAQAKRRPRPKPTPSPQVVAYRVGSNLQIHFTPAADGASHYRELNIWLRVFKLREQQHQAQLRALDYLRYPVARPAIEAAIERHQAPRNIALLRFLLAVLKAEGNEKARALDLKQVGIDASMTQRARPLIEAGLADAKAKANRYSSDKEQRARKVRLTLFTEANNYMPKWLQSGRNGTPHTDYAPYVPFFLGGDYESAVYAALYPEAEDKPIQFYWEGNGDRPVDVALATELSNRNKAYFDGLASLGNNPLISSTY